MNQRATNLVVICKQTDNTGYYFGFVHCKMRPLLFIFIGEYSTQFFLLLIFVTALITFNVTHSAQHSAPSSHTKQCPSECPNNYEPVCADLHYGNGPGRRVFSNECILELENCRGVNSKFHCAGYLKDSRFIENDCQQAPCKSDCSKQDTKFIKGKFIVSINIICFNLRIDFA